MSSTRQIYKRVNNLHKFHDNRSNDNMFHTGTLSFQASQQIKSADDISFSINTTKHFLCKIAKIYSLKKKIDDPPED